MAQKPRFGIVLSSRGVLKGWQTPEEFLELAEMVDSAGVFSHVWVGDTIMSKPRAESITMMAAIAARTKEVKIGVACMASFSSRNPVVLAYQWATLDVLSGGRMILGACIGGTVHDPENVREYRNMGFTAKDRAPRMEEGIDILRRLWKEDRVAYNGRFYQLTDASVDPKPVQDPPPIWIVSAPRMESEKPEMVERSLRRVALLSDGWMTGVRSSDPGAMFREMRGRIFEYAREYGRNFEELPCSLYHNINIKGSREEALHDSKEYLDSYYDTRHGLDTVKESVLLGTPQDCIEQLEAIVEDGPTDILLRCVSQDQKGQINRCAEEILPHFL